MLIVAYKKTFEIFCFLPFFSYDEKGYLDSFMTGPLSYRNQSIDL